MIPTVIPHHSVDDNRHYHRKDEKRHGQLRKERETGKNVARIEVPFLQAEINPECEESHQNGGGVGQEIYTCELTQYTDVTIEVTRAINQTSNELLYKLSYHDL